MDETPILKLLQNDKPQLMMHIMQMTLTIIMEIIIMNKRQTLKLREKLSQTLNRNLSWSHKQNLNRRRNLSLRPNQNLFLRRNLSRSHNHILRLNQSLRLNHNRRLNPNLSLKFKRIWILSQKRV